MIKYILGTVAYFFVALTMSLMLVAVVKADGVDEPDPLALVQPCEPAQRDYYYQYPDKIEVPKFEKNVQIKPIDEPRFLQLLVVTGIFASGWMIAKRRTK